MKDRKDLIPYVILVAVIWSYVVARAWLVPMVHDECASFLWYVQPGAWLPHKAHLDTNNHVTNSALGVLFAELFGAQPFTVRIGSMLAFLAYALGCWSLGKRVEDAVVRWCLWPALLMIPFVLDFFSMFRGYAIEMAAWVLGLEAMLRFATSGAGRHLMAALALFALAAVSMVVLLPTFAVALGLVGLIGLRSWRTLDTRERLRRALYMGAFGLLPLLLLVRLVFEFKEHGMLVYGGNDSFLQVTVRSLMLLVAGSDRPALSWFVVALVAACAIGALRTWSRTRDWSSPLVVLMAFLCGEVLLRVVMAVFAGANYPPDRTGMHYVPWVLCCFAFAVDGLSSRVRWVHWTALPLLALPVRTLVTANLDHVLIWPEQCIPARLVQRVLEEQERLGRPVVLGSHQQLKQCWLFAGRHAGIIAPFIQWERFPEGHDDLRLIDRRVAEGITDGYSIIDSADGPGLYLLRRTEPLAWEPLAVVSMEPRSGNEEYYDLVDIPDSLIREHALMLRIEVPITMAERMPDLGLVMEVDDSLGNHLLYDIAPLCAQRVEWKGDTLHYVRTLTAFPQAARSKLYVFNAGFAPIHLGTVRGMMARLLP